MDNLLKILENTS